ncbi:arsenosugar biosynthesis radical SAM protein ArsS [Acidobacteria bacterium AH-259-D05]|nr:arsenosugar biosynthesis radical SAM protein ArsS [Acidobacteria bacterium AH-259-D05]
MTSLKAAHHELSDTKRQIQILSQAGGKLPSFEERLDGIGLYPLTPTKIEILQVNVGKMCNQTCVHCHVDAGPDRDEIMSQDTMRHCLDAIKNSDIHTVDVTGGAPEMNPNFRWFVEEISKLGARTIVRSNLTILTVNNKYRQLPQFFADHKVAVISSLPCYTAENTDQQRGKGVFDRSIEALQMLNAAGYGQVGSGLELHLVYNPLGPFLPPPQDKLKSDYERVLKEKFGIVFNDLYCITNMPISRFLEYLLRLGKSEQYMETLVNAFNPAAAAGVMCRNTISVGWDGTLYDCDFNQMLGLEVEPGSPRHIRDFDLNKLTERRISFNQHCYGCTAGAGSSCGGEILK